MSERPSPLLTQSNAERSKGPSERVDDMLTVKLRAQQASKYYNAVGLSNGDLPRGKRASNSKSDLKRRSVSPNKSSNLAPTAGTPSSASLFLSPSKNRERWLKPRVPGTSSMKETSSGMYQASSKNEETNAMHHEQNSFKLSSKPTPLPSKDTFQSTHNHKVSATNTDVLKPVQFRIDLDSPHLIEITQPPMKQSNTLPRITADTVPYKSSSLGRESKFYLDRRASGQTSSHHGRCAQVESNLHLNKDNEKAADDIDYAEHTGSCELPHSKIKGNSAAIDTLTGSKSKLQLFEYETDEQRRVDSDDINTSRPKDDPNSSTSDDTVLDNLQVLSVTRQYGSTSSLDELGGKGVDAVDGKLLEFVQEYRKGKNNVSFYTGSPGSRHLNRKKTTGSLTTSPAHSTSPSPKPSKRSKDKLRSKSDVTDHKAILNNVPGLQNEGSSGDGINAFESLSEKNRRRRHNFSHYDWQSMTFSFQDVLVAMETLKRKNTTTGASKASALAAAAGSDGLTGKGSSLNGSQEDVTSYLDDDKGLESNRFNDVVASCPFFRNEIGGEQDRVICISASGLSVQVSSDGSTTTNAQSVLTNHTYLSIVERGNSDRLLPPGSLPTGSVSFAIEQVDEGADYYRTYFFEKDHQNFFGIDEKYGPVVISLRREKSEDNASGGGIYQYRVIVRTCELCTLRGSVLEDVISRHPPSKGFSAKDVLEYICPEVDMACLKTAVATPKIHEQLMKVDEHDTAKTCKVGILYCRAGQVTEEEMYNNEHGSAALDEFLQLLGHKIKLNGFSDFRGGLDVKTDSTGTESVFTTFNGYKMMFHVSTLLPFTPKNKQQVLRKRHIGNDILTIVFQEPGSEPFTPKYIRSHFQHVFIVVRAVKPCTDRTCYRVAVTRSLHISRFGPPIPEDSMFPKSSTFREFLLTKILNGTNAACSCGKFKALAMNTREQYLRDLALNSSTPAGLEGTPKFTPKFSISRRIRDSKEKQKNRSMPEILSRGALTWLITVDDYSRSEIVPCIMGMSDSVLAIIEIDTKQLIFSIPSQAILGWTISPPTSEQMKSHKRDLHIYYGRGEKLSLHTNDVESRDEIILRLERFTKGSETIYRQLRRNSDGELGFHVNYEGVTDVEPNGHAWSDGLKQSSRLVEICKVAVATMTHEEIIDLLRTSERVTVVIIPPNDDGTPRKCSMELYHLYPVLEVAKVPALGSSTHLQHERSRSEPARVAISSGKKPYTRHISEEIRNSPKHRVNNPAGKVETKDSSPSQTVQTLKSFVYNRTQANGSLHHSSKSKAAGVGISNGCSTRDTLESRKEFADSSSISISLNTLPSTKSAGDKSPLHSKQSVSAGGGGLNTNNNSSYSRNLNKTASAHILTSGNRTFSINPPPYDVACVSKSHFANNLTAPERYQFVQTKQGRYESPIKAVWKTDDLTPDPNQSFAIDCTSSTQVSKSLHVYVARSGDAQKKSKLYPTQSETLPTESSRKYSALYTPIKWRSPTVVAPRSTSQVNKKSTLEIPFCSSKATQRRKGTLRGSSSPNVIPSSPSPNTTNAVQDSLIRLLAESPTKQISMKQTPPGRRSPCRSASQRTSPKHKQSPVANVYQSRPVMQRTVSDESLCGARADGVMASRHGSSELLHTNDLHRHHQYGSVDSLVPSPSTNRNGISLSRGSSPMRDSGSLLPLPDRSDSWERILDAARAAEVFEAASMKSVSLGTLTEVGEAADFSGALTRDQLSKRTKSVERLYDHEYRGNQVVEPTSLSLKRRPINSLGNLLTHNSVTSQSIFLTSRDESELRLEKIEREMALLQERLKKEQESKKLLQDQVTSLRRDNQRLLRHVQANPEPVNGLKRSKRKPHS